MVRGRATVTLVCGNYFLPQVTAFKFYVVSFFKSVMLNIIIL